MSDEEEIVPEQVPEEIQPIRPMEPEGLHLYTRESSVEKSEPVSVPEAANVIDDEVSTFSVLWTGLKSLMATAIVITKAREAMTDTPTTTPPNVIEVEQKAWYTSKTLWLNGITMVWYFVGPLVGIPILSAEVTGVLLTGANILLRAITKQPVTIQ